VSSVYRVTGSIHDQILTEGAAEVVSEASAEITIVATNIESIVEVANNIPGDLAALPDAVTSANNAATRAETAAASAVGIDTSAQQSALTAQAAATAAAGSAAEVTEIVEGAGEAVDAANTAAGEASASATLAERWANETPGTVVADEKFSALHYATMTERMLATAPNLQFRVFGTHPGEAGTDSVEQTFNNAASDFGRGIAINRLANRPSKLKPLAGLFNGPPQEGADLAMVPTVLTNIGLSDCTIEGPATGSVSLEPAVLISGNETLYNVNTAEPAATPRITLDIPAGTNRCHRHPARHCRRWPQFRHHPDQGHDLDRHPARWRVHSGRQL